MTAGGPSDGTKVIAYYTYENAFSYLRLGHVQLSLINDRLSLSMVFIYIKMLKKRELNLRESTSVLKRTPLECLEFTVLLCW
jgi:ABC-type sugar transport system permease subunit